MDAQQRLTWLLERHLAGLATEEERRELAAILRSDDSSDSFRNILAQMMRNEEPSFPEDQARWQGIAQGIVDVDKVRGKGSVNKTDAELPVITMHSRKRWHRWAAAAAVVLLVVLGGVWLGRRQSYMTTEIAMVRDTVISTAKGEQKEVVLPDGTHIWLNAASSVRYAAAFNDQLRTVDLKGEAFFDVRHADKHPFIIHTDKATTTVLGTCFDIAAWPDRSDMTVSVQTGKVKVQAGEKVLAILERGRQVRVSANASVHEMSVDTMAIAAWRTGDLVYRDEMVKDIAADLERVFNDSIQIKTTALQTTRMTFSINRKMGLQRALDMICRITGGRLSHGQGIFIIE